MRPLPITEEIVQAANERETDPSIRYVRLRLNAPAGQEDNVDPVEAIVETVLGLDAERTLQRHPVRYIMRVGVSAEDVGHLLEHGYFYVAVWGDHLHPFAVWPETADDSELDPSTLADRVLLLERFAEDLAGVEKLELVDRDTGKRLEISRELGRQAAEILNTFGDRARVLVSDRRQTADLAEADRMRELEDSRDELAAFVLRLAGMTDPMLEPLAREAIEAIRRALPDRAGSAPADDDGEASPAAPAATDVIEVHDGATGELLGSLPVGMLEADDGSNAAADVDRLRREVLEGEREPD